MDVDITGVAILDADITGAAGGERGRSQDFGNV